MLSFHIPNLWSAKSSVFLMYNIDVTDSLFVLLFIITSNKRNHKPGPLETLFL